MIFIYSVGYHNFGQPEWRPRSSRTAAARRDRDDEHGHKHTVPSVEPMYSRFFAFIGLFAFGMYTLVVSDNLLTLFVGWEIMGLCSYLLIGFWYAKPSARDAAVKAFMTTRVGDVFMLLGIAYLYSATGTLTLPRNLHTEETLHALATVPSGCLRFLRGGLDRSAALHRHDRQIGAVPAARLAAGRDGRPDPGQRHDPCGDDGVGGCVCGHPHVPAAHRGWIEGSR